MCRNEIFMENEGEKMPENWQKKDQKSDKKSSAIGGFIVTKNIPYWALRYQNIRHEIFIPIPKRKLK